MKPTAARHFYGIFLAEKIAVKNDDMSLWVDT
jgi:hypothetical protein